MKLFGTVALVLTFGACCAWAGVIALCSWAVKEPAPRQWQAADRSVHHWRDPLNPARHTHP